MAKEKMTYEKAMSRIEEIASKLESDEVVLKDSINLYKEGMELTMFCKSTLETMEKEVMELKKSFDGSYVIEPFDKTRGD